MVVADVDEPDPLFVHVPGDAAQTRTLAYLSAQSVAVVAQHLIVDHAAFVVMVVVEPTGVYLHAARFERAYLVAYLLADAVKLLAIRERVRTMPSFRYLFCFLSPNWL